MFWQTPQFLLLDPLSLAATNVAIPPRRQRSDSVSHVAIRIQFAVQGVSSNLRWTAFQTERLCMFWLLFCRNWHNSLTVLLLQISLRRILNAEKMVGLPSHPTHRRRWGAHLCVKRLGIACDSLSFNSFYGNCEAKFSRISNAIECGTVTSLIPQTALPTTAVVIDLPNNAPP
jgi:hypothetical protein